MNEPKLRFKADDGTKFSDWEKNNFSDVFDNINNSTFSRDCLNYVDGNVKCIHYGDILTTFNSTVNVEASDVPYVNKDIDYQKYQLLADGDIIVADTAEDDTVGKVVEITNTNNVKVISGLHTIACRPKLKFTSGYLGYYMNSNPYHNQLRPYMQGIKVTSISKANIALTNISIPSLPEQQKIASLFTELDNLIQSAEKELEGYRELKQGMLQKMFPKKGEVVPEIRFPEFTGDWGKHRFSELVLIERGGSPRPINAFITKEASGLNWVKIGDAPTQGRFITKTAEKIKPEGLSKTREVHPGDLILSNSMSFGKPYIMGINGCIHDGWLLIRDVQKRFDLKFLCNMLSTEQMLSQYKSLAAGSTVNNLNKELVGNTIVTIPSIEEQRMLGDYFENLDNLIVSQQQELDGYKELKKGLLQQMFC